MLEENPNDPAIKAAAAASSSENISPSLFSRINLDALNPEHDSFNDLERMFIIATDADGFDIQPLLDQLDKLDIPDEFNELTVPKIRAELLKNTYPVIYPLDLHPAIKEFFPETISNEFCKIICDFFSLINHESKNYIFNIIFKDPPEQLGRYGEKYGQTLIQLKMMLGVQKALIKKLSRDSLLKETIILIINAHISSLDNFLQYVNERREQLSSVRKNYDGILLQVINSEISINLAKEKIQEIIEAIEKPTEDSSTTSVVPFQEKARGFVAAAAGSSQAGLIWFGSAVTNSAYAAAAAARTGVHHTAERLAAATKPAEPPKL